MRRRPRVLVITTGGTIDAVGEHPLDLASYDEGGKRLGAGDLLRQLPEAGQVASVTEHGFAQGASPALTTASWIELARIVQETIDKDEADGIVVTHGTATLEETAFFLHLVVRGAVPIVIVGAMRPASALSADGPLNLMNAIRVAAAPASRGLGVLVVLNDTIHGARDVTKGSTYRVDAFQGRDVGPLGYADADGSVVFYHYPAMRSAPRRHFDVGSVVDLPRVDIVVSYVGADGQMIDAAVAAGARGIVSAGAGSGRPTPNEVRALQRASASGVIVCQGTRTGSGRVVISPSLRRRHWVAGGNLVPWKARILLALSLTVTSVVDEIQEMFSEQG
jgi:L-asparaginase